MQPDFGPPNADSARQAIHAIRGYEYQILAAALAWVDLEETGLIYLEVAEDYAHVIGGQIEAVQVKATRGSGAVTLNTPAVCDAIESFVHLVARNPAREVHLRFLTTAPIGLEKSTDDRPTELPGLEYWRRARAGREDVGPLRELLERESSPEVVRTFCGDRTDEQLLEALIRRVTWDCGRPDTTTLRKELEERVIVFLRKAFDVPLQEAPPFADVVASHVLRRSAVDDVRDRVLSHPELLQLADSFSRVSVPRGVFDRLLTKALAVPDTSTPVHALVSAGALSSPPWIVDAASLPTPQVLVRREALETLVRSALSATGLCFLVGAAGTGKSTLAKCIAASFPGPRFQVDLRDIVVSEARNRLKQVFVLLADMGPATLILEDLNCLAVSSVQVSLSELIGAARRRDMRVVITNYRRPHSALLNALSANTASIVSSPYFALEETCALVATLGGDPDVWGRFAHVSGVCGHPQRTHAFLAGIAARGWPEDEISEIVQRGFTNSDLEDELTAARTTLIDSLPETTRDLLYRLSIPVAPFERSLAIAIGATEPPIDRAGECFDVLVDHWLEPAMANRYRPSPLVQGAGRKMLTSAQLRQVHNAIATELTRCSPIDAGDIDAILLHGLEGSSQSSLAKLTYVINVADDETRQAIARHLAVFPALDTSKFIYPQDLFTSVMLRLAQLRLVMATEERRGVDNVVDALLRETDALPYDPARPDFEGAVLGSILNTIGIARHLSNWVSLLSRFRAFVQAGPEDLIPHDPQIPPVAVPFSIGMAGLDSVTKLEAIFDELSRLDDDERRELLTPIDANVRDYFLLVHHPWTAESRRPNFDPDAAVNSYMKMADQADSWAVRTLGVQCRVAVAVILDEKVGDTARALQVLKEAEIQYDREAILSRAFAKLHRRIGNGTEALGYFRDAVSQMSVFGPLDAVYTVREAAICAAECGEWDTARTWFLRAESASDPLGAIGLGAIAVGLRADAAVASFQAADLRGTLTLMKDALLSLSNFDPVSNLQNAHCYRFIGHAILWLQAQVGGRDIKIDGQPVTMFPGLCSNPEPLPDVQKLPLGHIDFAWYMLVEIELTNSVDAGVREVVEQFGSQGHIPISEHMFRTQVLGATIAAQDASAFSVYFLHYLTSCTYCVVNTAAISRSFSALRPERVVFPALAHDGPYDAATERSARHAILVYGFRSLLVGGIDGIDQIRGALRQEFGDSPPGTSLFDDLDAGCPDAKDLDGEVASILLRFLVADHPSPGRIFLAGVRLLTWIANSQFKSFLLPCLKPWLMAQWGRILQSQRFLLRSPSLTTPPIVDVLRSGLEGEQFGAQLALVAEFAVGLQLEPDLRQELEGFVGGA